MFTHILIGVFSFIAGIIFAGWLINYIDDKEKEKWLQKQSDLITKKK